MLFNRRGFYPFQAGFPNYNFPLKRFNWSNFLTNANKTLGIVNQTIPLIHQIGPVVKNAKTMFRVFGELKKIDKEKESNNQSFTTSDNTSSNTTHNPNFFV
jgi:hypothetical protein